ncbi:MAG: hypothetical protein ACFFC7_12115 [Candidatus Hermodarchaeota archaeon]
MATQLQNISLPSIDVLARYIPALQAFFNIDPTSANILAALFFMKGNNVQRQVLRKHLSLSHPTIVSKIDLLSKKKLVQQFEDVKPVTIALLLSSDNLPHYLKEVRINHERAKSFLLKIDNYADSPLKRRGFTNTMQILLSTLNSVKDRELITEILAVLYFDRNEFNNTISLSKLLEHIKQVNDQRSKQKKPRFLVSQHSYHFFLRLYSDIFHSYSALEESCTMIRPTLPLKNLVKGLYVQLENQFDYYTNSINTLLSIFNGSESEQRVDLIQHTYLRSIYEIRRKLDACLRLYPCLYIVDNNFYSSKDQGLLELLTERLINLIQGGELEHRHKINIFVTENQNKRSKIRPKDLENLKKVVKRVEIYKIPNKQAYFEFTVRDLILFVRDMFPYTCVIFDTVNGNYSNSSTQITNPIFQPLQKIIIGDEKLG